MKNKGKDHHLPNFYIHYLPYSSLYQEVTFGDMKSTNLIKRLAEKKKWATDTFLNIKTLK